jgi:uncharacterized paraquat-inducible protein A
MLYDNDIALTEKAVTLGFRDQDSCNAWERIKKELSELAQLSHNTGSPKFCFNCKEGSVLEQKMVDSKYEYCPYCGAKLRASA